MVTQVQKFLNTQVSQLVGRAKTGDYFGLEIECEGRNINGVNASVELSKAWKWEHDGSLRNHHGEAFEWVFRTPVKYKTAVDRVNKLFDYFGKNGAKLVCSNRTSTHVHFNMGDKSVYQVVNLFIVFTILEDILDSYCGEDRNGNLFCLSSRHAEAQVKWMTDACLTYFNFNNFGNNVRYCSLNLASLHKFGTVEFRGMRGLDNRDDVLSWLSIINELCNYACYKMGSPVDLIQQISEQGPSGFLQSIFSEENVTKLRGDRTDDDIGRSIYDGLRLVQMLCYRIGTEFDKVVVRGPDFWEGFAEDKAEEEPVDDNPFIRALEGGDQEVPLRRGAEDFELLRNRLEPLVQRPLAAEHHQLINRLVGG